jgi:hypothetical protein
VKLLMNSIYGKSIMKEILNEDEDFTEMWPEQVPHSTV